MMTNPATDPGDERIDWRGDPVRCDTCAQRLLLFVRKCAPGHACVEDRYARRIDRFFDWNPDLANDHVNHKHFEVRAIAAKHADVFRLPALLDDPEEAVRWNAVRRLPMRYKKMLRDAREVRIRIAGHLDDADLVQMMQDSDYYVRLVVARRIAPALLGAMMQDEEPEVRRVVASRISPPMPGAMVHDPDPLVRLCVAERMTGETISAMRGDVDWRVRHAVASRTSDAEILRLLTRDQDPLVREMASDRLYGNDAPHREMAS